MRSLISPDAVVRVAVVEYILEAERAVFFLLPQEHLPLAVRATAQKCRATCQRRTGYLIVFSPTPR